MRAWTLALLMAAGLVMPVSADAKPKLQEAVAPLPDIEEMLTQAGWTMTPEMSAKFSRPGDILDAKNTTLVDGADCFEAEVKEGAFAKMEVTRSMSAGVRMRVKVVGVRGGVGLEKKIIFDTPIYRQISRFKLVPTEVCAAFIHKAQRQGEDISSWYVITESLSAVIQQQQCGEYNAKAGTFLVSADASITQACAQTSLEPVAVAYKLAPVTQILGQTTASVVPTSTPTPTATAPAQATSSVDFGSSGTGMDVAEKLRQQQCDEQAKTRGAQARANRLATAKAEVLSKARVAWTKLEPELEMCAKLKRSEREGCITAANNWLSVARAMQVNIPAGIESVQTDCGERQPAYPAATQTVSGQDLARAEGLLQALQKAAIARNDFVALNSRHQSDIEAVVNKKKSQVAYCYEQSLKANPYISGQLRISMSVMAGRVNSASVLENGTGDTAIELCILSKVKRWRFPVHVTEKFTMPFELEGTSSTMGTLGSINASPQKSNASGSAAAPASDPWGNPVAAKNQTGKRTCVLMGLNAKIWMNGAYLGTVPKAVDCYPGKSRFKLVGSNNYPERHPRYREKPPTCFVRTISRESPPSEKINLFFGGKNEKEEVPCE